MENVLLGVIIILLTAYVVVLELWTHSRIDDLKKEIEKLKKGQR
ncbi:hypothetical protein [Helicobacter sp. 12S02634-8]|nr:hypothetical protein [Helicobacter sp. 12S02634-8]